MTRDEAISTIALLREHQNLSHEEVCKGFQIALALFDEQLITFFKECYYHFIYNITLDIALHIDQPGKIELFKKYETEWEMISDYHPKLILIAIIHKSMSHLPELDIFIHQLTDKYINYSSYRQNEFTALLKTNLNELIASYLDYPQMKISQNFLYSLYNRALESSDMMLLEKAMHQAEAEKDEDILARIQGRVASFKVNENIVDALEIATTIKIKESRDFALYDIAKRMYDAQAFQSSRFIVSCLPMKFQYGFRAFIASSKKDEEEIGKILYEIEKLNETHCMSNDDYEQYLTQVAYDIVDNYPYIVRDINEKVYPLGDDIGAEVAVSLSKKDLEKGIAYALSLDADFFQVDSIIRIIESIEDESLLTRLLTLSEYYNEDANIQYDILKAINKKIPLPFKQIWGLTSKMLPM